MQLSIGIKVSCLHAEDLKIRTRVSKSTQLVESGVGKFGSCNHDESLTFMGLFNLNVTPKVSAFDRTLLATGLQVAFSIS
jgi:hypothetical protein